MGIGKSNSKSQQEKEENWSFWGRNAKTRVETITGYLFKKDDRPTQRETKIFKSGIV